MKKFVIFVFLSCFFVIILAETAFAKSGSSIEYTLPESLINVTIDWESYDAFIKDELDCDVSWIRKVSVTSDEIRVSKRKVEVVLKKAALSNLSTSIEIDVDGFLKSGNYKSTGQAGNILKSLTKIVGSLALFVSAEGDKSASTCSDEDVKKAQDNFMERVKSAVDSITIEIESISEEIDDQQELIERKLKELAESGIKKESEDLIFQISSAKSLIAFLTDKLNSRVALRDSFKVSDPSQTNSSTNIKVGLTNLSTLLYKEKINKDGSSSTDLLVIPAADSSSDREFKFDAQYSPNTLRKVFGDGLIFLTSDGEYRSGVKKGLVLVRVDNKKVYFGKKSRKHKGQEETLITQSDELLFPRKRSQQFQLFTITLDEKARYVTFDVDSRQDILNRSWLNIDPPFFLDTYNPYGPFNKVDISSQAFGENDINFTTSKGILRKLVYNSQSGLADAVSSVEGAFASYTSGLKVAKGIVDAKKDLKIADISSKKEILDKEVELLTSETNFDYANLSKEDALKLKLLTNEIALLQKEKGQIEATLDLEYAEQLKRLAIDKSLVDAKKNLSASELALINAEIALLVAQQTRIDKLEAELEKVKEELNK